MRCGLSWILVLSSLELGCDSQVGAAAYAATANASASAAPTASAAALPSAASAPPTSGPSASAPPPPSASAELETVEDQPEAADASAEASCAPLDPELKAVEIMRFTFTDAVENKIPRNKLTVARPGQRIHSHFVLRNRSGRERCIKIELRVNGKRRTTLTQKVGKSWSWRTWGYNTLRSDDRGKLEAIVRDDQGKELLKKELPIVPEG